MKRPLAYITAAWCGDPDTDMELAARYCRMAYEAGFSPICPILYLPLFINDAIPEEHKNGIDMRRDNVIMANRKKLKNPNGLYLGVPGSGKSFSGKRELVNVFLATNDRIIILDPIHSHIYYNSTTLDCTRKFRNFWGSSFALRRLSDRLCLENGLSIVENPKPRSKGKFRNYGEWQAGQKKPLTYQDRLRAAIDTVLAKRPADFPAFLSLMEQAGYEVKQRRGAISFRAPGQERFTRLRSDTLGEGYSEADIRAALSGSRQRPGQPRPKISLAIDIQSRLQGKGPGYERWAKVFNLKQMAAALAYLQDNGLTDYEQLEQKATAATERFHKLSDEIKSTEAALHTNMELKAATVQYAKTRPVFEKYKASKYSKKFLAEHEADIELYRAACADFKAILGGAKLPKMDTLKEEGRKLSEQKKKLYAEYRKTKADMQEVTTIKANIDYLLGYSEPGRKKEQER